MKSTPPPAGYSGTPLSKKLGIKEGTTILLIADPDEFRPLLEPLPPGVKFARTAGPRIDFAHVFVTSRAVLDKHLRALRAKLRPDAGVWVSWPKKTARVETDVTEDVIRDVALPLGFVDIKVCAVNEVWSGLRLAVRKELRGGSK